MKAGDNWPIETKCQRDFIIDLYCARKGEDFCKNPGAHDGGSRNSVTWTNIRPKDGPDHTTLQEFLGFWSPDFDMRNLGFIRAGKFSFEPLWDLSKKDLESRTRGVAFSFFGSSDLCIVRKVGFENSTKNKSCGASSRI